MSDIIVEILELIVEIGIDLLTDSTSSRKSNSLNNYTPVYHKPQKKYDTTTIFKESSKSYKTNKHNPNVNTGFNNQKNNNESLELKTNVSKQDHSSYSHIFNPDYFILESMMLIYVYNEDDGKLSFKEKKEIKKHFSKYKNKLTQDDLERVKDLQNHDSSLTNLRAHISQNNLTENDVMKALDFIKRVSSDNSDYLQIHKRLYSGLLNSIGY